jgi:hypothetical protein
MIQRHEYLTGDILGDTIFLMKLVLDTDVIVAALRSPAGASAELIRMARRREISVLMLEAEAYFTERLARADLGAFDRLMARTSGEAPREGDEKPAADTTRRP